MSINAHGDDDDESQTSKVNPLSESQKKKFAREELMASFTMNQDETEIPVTNEILDWRLFNVDFYSKDREYAEVEKVVEANLDKMIDIRPYIIDTPYLAQSTDRLQKVLELFRHMHLRALAVTNPGTGALEGIITRQDIFAYMGL